MIDYMETASELLCLHGQFFHRHHFSKLSEYSKGEFGVLNFLLDHENEVDITPGMLCEHSPITSARIAVILNKLEEKHCVIRKDCLLDKRKTLVYLTDSGRELITNRRHELHSEVANELRALGEKDTLEYIRILNKIIDISQISQKGTLDESI